GFSFLDLSTGQFTVREVEGPQALAGEIGRLAPAELLLPQDFRERAGFNDLAAAASLGPGGRIHLEMVDESLFDRRRSVGRILDHFQAPDLKALGIDHLSAGLSAAGAVLAYVAQTQRTSTRHIVRLEVEEPGRYLQMDETTHRHLELFFTLAGKRGPGTLIHVLDKTLTAMGGRLVRRWLAYPVVDAEAISRRQEAVAGLFEAGRERAALRELLKKVADLERLCGRIVMAQASPRDLVSLKDSVAVLGRLQEVAADVGSPALTGLVKDLDLLTDLHLKIDRAIRDDPALGLKEGGIFKPGFSPELDELLDLKSNSQAHIAAIENRERVRSGISSLKVRYNRVFGYYIEVSKANLDKVPEDYRRKQTLTNHERFSTPELQTYEAKVLSAGAAQAELEYQLFVDLRQALAREAERIKRTAALVARLDALAGLAEVAQANDYHRPRLDQSGRIELIACRHPVVEEVYLDEPFVPNDIRLDMTDQQVLILTGPNMAGKSTILRQVALCQIMAQMGGFIPAKEASLGLVDRVFTRVGAGDELARGRSTFLVEMAETARILNQVTPQSLVVLDEIGRGTSTFDGLSLAWAVVEHLHDFQGRGVKTLMATHYHELTELASLKSRVKNYTMAVKKIGERIVFLRTLTPGGVSRSYGIEVARLAGLPLQVIKRAKNILADLEEGAPLILHRKLQDLDQPDLFSAAPPDQLRRRLAQIEPEQTTPLEALTLLVELKELV
ncbi:MAG: DNA mismatch repair protein MutS, partial [Deltaproteobacteria bacterium]|nr:DNA mismatch repair protein MutS [Deltaproteobacteria bacterium]